MSELPSVRIKNTHLGRSVYADIAFARGQSIARIAGAVVHDAEYGSEYCVEFGDGRVLEPEAPFRFLNHSCEPNCELTILAYEDPEDWEIHVYTIRSVEAGEELCIDYAWPAEYAIPCRCGRANCRGWIVREDELDGLRELRTNESGLPALVESTGQSD